MFNALIVLTRAKRNIHRAELALGRINRLCSRLNDITIPISPELNLLRQLVAAAAKAAAASFVAAENAYSILPRHLTNLDDVLDLQSTIDAAVDSVIATADLWEKLFRNFAPKAAGYSTLSTRAFS